MNALIISLKFHPGHFSHLTANYKLLQECGFDSYLYVADGFNKMDENNKFLKINNSAKIKDLKKIDLSVFWFPSLKNIWEMFKLRFFYGSKIFYVYHEPFDSIKNYYQSGFNAKKIIKICLINLAHLPILLLSHKIILPSLSSFKIYKKKYAFINNRYAHISLLFDDEVENSISTKKEYFSYIGTIAADHAFAQYVDFIENAIKNSWLPGIKFKIATSSTISEDFLEKLNFLQHGP